jgi:ATP-binding cassette subfamily B protein
VTDSSPLQSEPLSAATALRSLRVLFAASFASAPFLAAATFALMPIGQAQMQLSALWSKIVTDGVFRHDTGEATLGAALLAVSAAAFVVQALGTAKLRLRLTERAGFWLDRRTAELVATVPGLEHHEHSEYQNRLALLRDQRGLLGQGINALLSILAIIGQLALTVVLLTTVSPWLLLVAVPSGLGLLLVPRQQKRWREMEERLAANTVLDGALYDLATGESAAKEVRVFGLQEDIVRRYESSWREVYAGNIRAARRNMTENALAYGLPTLSVVAAVAFVALRASHGAASPGDVTMAAGLAAQLSATVGSMVGISNWLLTLLRGVGRLIWLEDYAASARPASPPTGHVPQQLVDGIRFERVNFTYPSASSDTASLEGSTADENVLDGIDLHLPAGSVVAFVGENGAGKTTLVKLLCRFYDPTAGRILLDGADLRDLAHAEWWENVAAGFQDFGRFELTVQHTVGVGDLPRLDEPAAVNAALARAGGTDVLDRLDGRLGAQLGRQWDSGEELSGGQWQKLALGRAFMREAPLLLVLDEPTSALDADTEHALFEGFRQASRRLSNGAVTVLVSHRFSTVRMANLIIVMERGRVREAGTHDELMELGGLYAELYELQARGYR